MKIEVDSIDESVVTLDSYNSDLNLVIDASKFSAQSLTKEGFAFMWAGARATHGAAKGKFCFEVKVIEHLDVSHLPSDEPNPHVVRVGFSVDSTSMQLGEDPLSYGYGGTGKISTNCQFKDFGPAFMAGDCILAVADMDSDLVQIGFAKNGSFIGWAYKIKKTELQGKALFPHVLTKNCSFEVNFGQREEPYFKLPDSLKEYIFVGCLPMDQRVAGSRPPEKREDCEMIMMCGLPGAGKSVWAADYSLKNPDKKYNVLGTNNIIDKMKVMGLPRKRNYAGRWDVLIQMATKCLNAMFAIGSKLRRNYILDQTNVYPTAQRRKMRNFDGFKRIAVVVVPSETEYKRRCDKRDREEGKEIPDSAVLEMKANFKLPEVGDVFDEVRYTELQREEAEKLVKEYNEEGKAAMGPARKQFKPNEPVKDNKGFDNRKGNFGFNKSDSRGGYGNFPPDRGMRGSQTFGGNRSDYNRGNLNNRGGFNGGRGSRGGNFGMRENYSAWGGYGEEGSYDNPGGYGDRSNFDSYHEERQGYDNNYGNMRGGGGRSAFEDKRGGYESNRSGGRGGYESNQGGIRGGLGVRGGYDRSRDSGRGGYEGNQGGKRGGYDGARGGARGGYNSNRGSSRGGYDASRGASRGSFDSSRGGSKVDYDSSRGGRLSDQDNYDRRDTYNAYGKEPIGRNYGAGYGGNRDYDSRSHFDQGVGGYRGDYNADENIPGGSRPGSYSYSDYGGDSYSSERFTDRGYGSVSQRGTSSSGFHSGNREATPRGTSQSGYRRDMHSDTSSYNTGSSPATQDSYSRDYSYGSGGMGNYNSQSTADTYTSRGSSSSYTAGFQNTKKDPVQRFAGSNLDTGNKPSQGYSAYSGAATRATRWSSDIQQTPSSAETYSTGRSQSYDYSKTNQSAANYQGKQTYGMQQGTAPNTPPQWMAGNTTASNPAGYGSGQAQWMPYGQQVPNQYYSQ